MELQRILPQISLRMDRCFARRDLITVRGCIDKFEDKEPPGKGAS